MTVYRYKVNNDLSVGALKIQDGMVSFMPNDSDNRDWAAFMEWYNSSLANRPQEAW